MPMAVAARPRERELLATATRLFRQRGFHAASMQDLGEALGMNRGNLYHYIASKDDLLWTILTGALDLLEARVESVLTDERRRQMIQRRNAYEDLWRAALNDGITSGPVSYTHLRAHETRHDLVCRLLLEKKKKKNR